MENRDSQPEQSANSDAPLTRRRFFKVTVASTAKVGAITLVGSTVVTSMFTGGCEKCPDEMTCETNACPPAGQANNNCASQNVCEVDNDCPTAAATNNCTGDYGNKCQKDNKCDTGSSNNCSGGSSNICGLGDGSGKNICDGTNVCVDKNWCYGSNSCSSAANHTCTGQNLPRPS